ncbi:hypothetical protein [Anaerosporobacter sp.]|uniref:hypothetical protein n=1 Tax=Anaerosporobacter sp. TaxID=1872529 RepID=UPI00286F44AF|nr:hypothetical protein [Anaerosporobacter sp.]
MRKRKITQTELKAIMFDCVCDIYNNPSIEVDIKDNEIFGNLEVFTKMLFIIQRKESLKNGRKKNV